MSTSYTEKTHSAFHGAPIDTSDPKTLAWLIRRHGLEMTHISRGSHIGAIFSVAEIMAVLYTRILRVDPKNPQWENRDRLILSKGHAGASVYAALAERGFFPVEELSTHYANGSRPSGHVSPQSGPQRPRSLLSRCRSTLRSTSLPSSLLPTRRALPAPYRSRPTSGISTIPPADRARFLRSAFPRLESTRRTAALSSATSRA